MFDGIVKRYADVVVVRGSARVIPHDGRATIPVIFESAPQWRHVIDVLGEDKFVRDRDFDRAMRAEPSSDGVTIRRNALAGAGFNEDWLVVIASCGGDLVLHLNKGDKFLKQRQAYIIATHPNEVFRQDEDYARAMKWVPVRRDDGVYMGDHRADVPISFSAKQAERVAFYAALKAAGVESLTTSRG